MQSIQDSKKFGKSLVLRPGTDGSTLKETAFNDFRWGDETRDYAESAKNLAEQSFQEICDQAKQMSKPSRRARRSEASDEDAPKPVRRRALLVDACEFTIQRPLYTALILPYRSQDNSPCDSAAKIHVQPAYLIILPSPFLVVRFISPFSLYPTLTSCYLVVRFISPFFIISYLDILLSRGRHILQQLFPLFRHYQMSHHYRTVATSCRNASPHCCYVILFCFVLLCWGSLSFHLILPYHSVQGRFNSAGSARHSFGYIPLTVCFAPVD